MRALWHQSAVTSTSCWFLNKCECRELLWVQIVRKNLVPDLHIPTEEGCQPKYLSELRQGKNQPQQELSASSHLNLGKEKIKETVKHILVTLFSATMHCLPFSLGWRVSVFHWLSQQMYSSYTYNDDYFTNCQLYKWHWSSWQADCVLILHISK